MGRRSVPVVTGSLAAAVAAVIAEERHLLIGPLVTVGDLLAEAKLRGSIGVLRGGEEAEPAATGANQLHAQLQCSCAGRDAQG